MAKTKTTPQAPAPTQVTTAAKRPNRTKKFLADISAALDIFDDEISSVGDCRATAYETFISSYRTAFAHIWPKIKAADVKIVLQSVKDKELNELRRMSQMMSSDSSKLALIKENRSVPALENILGSMVNRLPDQKLPDKDTCTLIPTILNAVPDQELVELGRMRKLLNPSMPQPKVLTEQRKVPALEQILGAMTAELPKQKLPNSQVCGLIADIFSDLTKAHSAQAQAAKGLADLATTVTP